MGHSSRHHSRSRDKRVSKKHHRHSPPPSDMDSSIQYNGIPSPLQHSLMQPTMQPHMLRLPDKYDRPLEHHNAQFQQGFEVEREKKPKWGWCPLVTAFLSLLCCPLLGFCSTVCAVLSYTDYKVEDYRNHRRKRCWSICCSVFAILLFMCVVTAIILLVFFFPNVWTAIYGRILAAVTRG